MSDGVILRHVTDDDLPLLFEHQRETEACQMAAFPPRDWEAFLTHWTKILGDESLIARTILFNGQVAGSIGSFEESGQREIGYWIGKAHWGQGIATQALSLFLDCVEVRPLYAHVAKHNIASRRVLEKCGFAVIGEESGFLFLDGKAVEEFVLKLGEDTCLTS